MISVIGWLNGLSLVFLLIFEVIYGLILILKSIKTKAKLIRIAGLTCIFIGLAHTECSINFLYYLATSENLIEIKSLFFLFNTTMACLELLSATYLGIGMNYQGKKRRKFTILNFGLAIVLMFFLVLNLDNNYSVFIPAIGSPSEGSMIWNLKMGSPLSLILLIWIIFVIYLLGFKSIKNALSHDGVIRKKYFLLGLGTIIIATSQAIAGFTTSFILLTVFRTTILFASLVFYYSLRSEPEKKKKEIKIEHGIFRIIKSSEPHLSLQEKESYDNLQDGISVFFSYATVDASYFKIPQFAKKLISYDEILEVRYWQKDMRDDILKFMNDNLKECDILLLFCSENALQSDPVEMEWQSALKIGKKIIPIFVQEKNIPPLLSTKLGVQFNKNNLNETINSVHDLILKKLR